MARRLDTLLVLTCGLYVAGVALALVLMWQLVDRWWPATLLAFGPRWPLAVPALPLAGLAAWRKRRRWAVALAVTGLLALGPYMDLSLPLWRSQPDVPEAAPRLSVATYNIQQLRLDSPEVERLVGELDVDLLALEECRNDHAETSERYGRQLATTYGLCLLSRHPIVAREARNPRDAWERGGSAAVMRVTLDVEGRLIDVVVLHLESVREGLEALRQLSPGGLRDNIEQRRWESEVARSWADQAKNPLLVMGDLNLPVESAIYRRYWSSFVNAFDECGLGYGHTKHTRFFGTRIDHILMSDAFRCESVEVGDQRDSDHSPLRATLQLR